MGKCRDLDCIGTAYPFVDLSVLPVLVLCDLDIDFSVGTDLIGFCFLGLIFLFFVLSDLHRKFQIFG